MEVLLLGIYSFFVWLIFIKLKWLPWNITSQVIVAIIPIVGLTVMILTLNIVAPSSSKLRVYRYTVPIVSQVRGRVLEVPIEEGNRLVRKGDVLFRIDPEQFKIALDNAKAQLAQTALNLQSMKQDYQRMLSDAGSQEAQVELAQKTYDRASDLLKKGVTSAQAAKFGGLRTRIRDIPDNCPINCPMIADSV